MTGRIVTWLRRVVNQRRQHAVIRRILSKTRSPWEGRFIVSLSTLPDRIGQLRPTLDSLLRQTRPPDEVVLVIPEFSERQKRTYKIPGYLASIPTLRILRSKKDWGPATKFIPVLQEEIEASRDHTLIMVADDDRIYPSDSIEIYLHYHAQMPEAGLCFRGGPVPPGLDWRDCQMIFGPDIQNPERVAVMTGCGSYLIQPRFFDERLWDYSHAPEGAFYMDDIWISGWLERRGVGKYVVPASHMMRTVFRQFGTMTLHDVPKGRIKSNNETIAFFRDDWKV